MVLQHVNHVWLQQKQANDNLFETLAVYIHSLKPKNKVYKNLCNFSKILLYR